MATEFIGIVVGDSAYEIAVKDGFTGTQTEWLASLKGPAGAGEDGKAATIEVGTVSTLPAGSQATVENVGTTVDAVLNFAIPQGAKGADGSGSGGGIEEAPEDGKQYARQDAAWVEVEASGTYDDSQIKADITSLQNDKADKTAIPDVSGFATSVELQSMNVSLTASIAAKQPAGDYATNTALTQGLATKQPTGEYALASDIPTVPTTLPNPNALTINGTAYDGSEAVTLTIEGGGGEGAALATDEEWDTGTTTAKAPNVAQVKGDIDSLKELFPKIVMKPSLDQLSVSSTWDADSRDFGVYRALDGLPNTEWYSGGDNNINVFDQWFQVQLPPNLSLSQFISIETWFVAGQYTVGQSVGIYAVSESDEKSLLKTFTLTYDNYKVLTDLQTLQSLPTKTIAIHYRVLSGPPNVVNFGVKEVIGFTVAGYGVSSSTAVPTGALLGWELPTLPTGYLWCDGNAVPNEYPELQALMVNTPSKEGFIIQATSL